MPIHTDIPRIHSDRNFGIEIECFGPSMEDAADALRAAGIEIQIEGYNHHTRPVWKIVPDSSVNDGFEVVSPILSGNDGLNQVATVAKTLLAAGARVDRRCGFHVHVNARDLVGADVLNCIRRYALHESVIDGFMPVSRRASNNYCRPMNDIVRAIRGVSDTATVAEVARRVYERYYKLNVAAFTRHGTIEFRQHAGTVDFRKMINWIIFCIAFVEDSRAIAIDVPAAQPSAAAVLRRNAVEVKFLRIAELLDNHTERHNPISGVEIAAELGVDESSVPSYISQFRTRYPRAQIQARRGRGYYRDCTESLVDMVNGTSAPQGPSVRYETPQDRGVFASLNPELANYFHERATDLSMGS